MPQRLHEGCWRNADDGGKVKTDRPDSLLDIMKGQNGIEDR